MFSPPNGPNQCDVICVVRPPSSIASCHLSLSPHRPLTFLLHTWGKGGRLIKVTKRKDLCSSAAAKGTMLNLSRQHRRTEMKRLARLQAVSTNPKISHTWTWFRKMWERGREKTATATLYSSKNTLIVSLFCNFVFFSLSPHWLLAVIFVFIEDAVYSTSTHQLCRASTQRSPATTEAVSQRRTPPPRQASPPLTWMKNLTWKGDDTTKEGQREGGMRVKRGRVVGRRSTRQEINSSQIFN